MLLRIAQLLLLLLLLQTLLTQGKPSSGCVIDREVCQIAEQCKKPYVVVIDAGSTGTRLHVFQLERNQSLTAGARPLSEKKSKKIQPGLDSFAFAPQRIHGYLQPLIAFAKQNIPEASHKEAMLFMGSTAGVRALPFAQKRAIVHAAADALRRTPFKVRYEHRVGPFVPVVELTTYLLVIVLSGHYEGFFGWMAVNFLMNTFGSGTYGVLDLGGGSTQIAFFKESYGSVFNGGQISDASIFTQSYLGLGKSAATLDMLGFNRQTRMPLYKSPCLHPKFAGNFSFGSASISVAGDPATTSASRWTECQARARVPLKRIPVHRAPAGNSKIFVAVSAYYHVSQSLAKLGHLPRPIPGKVTLGEVTRAAENACAKPPTSGKYEAYLCMDSAYMVTLLKEGYGFRDDQVLHMVDSIHGFSPGWPMGMAFTFVTQPLLIGVPMYSEGYIENKRPEDPGDK